MKRKTPTRYSFKQHDGIQSKQEELIKTIYPNLKFKPHSIGYMMQHNYFPDFFLGVDSSGLRCYLELKEYMREVDIPKYVAVLESNTHVKLYFLIHNAPTKVFTRLAQLPRCIVQQGYTNIPQEWLDDTRSARITDSASDTSRAVEPPSVYGLQRLSGDND